MYLSISLKNPPITLVVKGTIDDEYCKLIHKVFSGVLRYEAPDGLPMLIPVGLDSNISYIKEITAERYKEMEENRKKQMEEAKSGAIVRPDVMSGIPGRNFPRGRH